MPKNFKILIDFLLQSDFSLTQDDFRFEKDKHDQHLVIFKGDFSLKIYKNSESSFYWTLGEHQPSTVDELRECADIAEAIDDFEIN